MTKMNKLPVREVLESLAKQEADLPPVSVDGKQVDPPQVADALRDAVLHLKPSAASLFRWLFYSAGFALLLLCCAKVMGLLAATKLTAGEFRHEMLFHGDLLLISAAFACETIGNLIVASPGKQSLKSAIGFFCVLALMISIVIIACCASLPPEPMSKKQQEAIRDPDSADSIATTTAIIRYSTIPVFLGTLLAVSLTKLKKGE
jgi:hypothetical protein